LETTAEMSDTQLDATDGDKQQDEASKDENK
jgi:hypothetical protein